MVRQLLEATSQRAANYLERLDQRPVRPDADGVAGLAAFDKPLPSEPTAPEAVLTMMDEIGSPATMAMAGPRFFGFVIGGSLPVTLAANWLTPPCASVFRLGQRPKTTTSGALKPCFVSPPRLPHKRLYGADPHSHRR